MHSLGIVIWNTDNTNMAMRYMTKARLSKVKALCGKAVARTLGLKDMP